MGTAASPFGHVKREITGFYVDQSDRLVLEPLLEAASRFGYSVTITDEVDKPAEIGIYSMHCGSKYAVNAKLSVVMPHDMAQDNKEKENFWEFERWNGFDIGLLPNHEWAASWQQARHSARANPRIGVFVSGWTKADAAIQHEALFKTEVAGLRSQLGLVHSQSVLYAPSWEIEEKQNDFVQALLGLPVNLLIKQPPLGGRYEWLANNIREMAARHTGLADNIYMVNAETGIMHCLALADVVVSDESSVLAESLLFVRPAVSVIDWRVPEKGGLRESEFSLDGVFRIYKKDLRQKITHLLKYASVLTAPLQEKKEHFFPYAGESVGRIYKILNAVLLGYMPAGKL